MKREISILIFCLPLIAVAQTDTNYKGIKFEDQLSWNQIKAKARQENKYIFVDCYTTWCGPCKHMDKNIYPNENVGKAMNDKFISVKVQFDRTSKDNKYIRSWYSVADSFHKEHNIKGYPTYLFFSPEGNIVHREMGAKLYPKYFISVTQAALDTSRQYYTLLNAYKGGKRDVKVLKQLSRATKAAGNEELAEKIVDDYLLSIDKSKLFSQENIAFMSEFTGNKKVKEIVRSYKVKYLDKLNEDHLCTKENLKFVKLFAFVVNSKDRFFKLFYYQPRKANKLMEDSSFSQRFVWNVIRKEEILDKLYKDEKPITLRPNWNKIRVNILRKYGRKYADKLTPDQIVFYKTINNWSEFARLFEMKMKVCPPQKGKNDFTEQVGGVLLGDETTLNESAWQVFLYCKDTSVLEKAVSWSDYSMKLIWPNTNPQFLDTKANLLYKLGKVNEAIQYEQEAINIEIDNSNKEGRVPSKSLSDFITVIEKMKRGEKTWSN